MLTKGYYMLREIVQAFIALIQDGFSWQETIIACAFIAAVVLITFVIVYGIVKIITVIMTTCQGLFSLLADMIRSIFNGVIKAAKGSANFIEKNFPKTDD